MRMPKLPDLLRPLLIAALTWGLVPATAAAQARAIVAKEI